MRRRGPHGVLVVDKPVGPTSHDVVAQARRQYQTRTVGHAGTLDPLASGVLLLLFGEATKLSGHLTLERKRYRATLVFGRSTDTLDADGTTTATRELPPNWLVREQLEAALAAERVRRWQVPPAFSAIKVAGRRAHRASRAGEPVELQPREVEVVELSLLGLAPPSICVELTVSKGYYVRSFARDVATHLGVPGHLAALRRLASGRFTLDEAQQWPAPEPPPLLSVADAAARALPIGRLTPTGVRRAACGQRLVDDDFLEQPPSAQVSAWVDEAGRLVALGEPREGGFAVVRGFGPT